LQAFAVGDDLRWGSRFRRPARYVFVTYRHFFLPLLILWLGGGVALAETARVALRALPKADAKKLAGIEARNGQPGPDQWRFLVRDSKSAAGLREYIVAGGEIVSSGEVTETAATAPLKATFDSSAIKIDSDQAAALALKEAAATGTKVASLNYLLLRETSKATPVWVVTCLDAQGREAGAVALSASRGKIIARERFAQAEVRPPAPVSPMAASPSAPVAPVAPAPAQGVDQRAVESDRAFLAAVENQTPAAPAAGTSAAQVSPPPADAVAPAPRTEAHLEEPAAIARAVPSAPNRSLDRGGFETPPAAPSEPEGEELAAARAPISREAVAGEPFTEEPASRDLGAEEQTARSDSKPRETAERSKSSRGVSISPVGEVRRATRPVRRIIRRVLPF
jgi:hypothetical protein